ncbi:hypothetical protein FOCG_02870 [Fusarium oxysporum f. sp. radicis-lycopersici 26381]|nr:hypothetical protein FOCG_02870 [Fusarium oxysporum f. sp. radicis-lycopersici 26381]EXL59753.1 hypothetical protein FOCG_02870 [Fusarium oxysporum f. sp. radicis-lycopersici 26381]
MQINVPHPLLTFQVPRPIGEPLDLGNEWGDKLTSSDALDLKSEWCSTSLSFAKICCDDDVRCFVWWNSHYTQYVHYHDKSYIVGLRLKMRRYY